MRRVSPSLQVLFLIMSPFGVFAPADFRDREQTNVAFEALPAIMRGKIGSVGWGKREPWRLLERPNRFLGGRQSKFLNGTGSREFNDGSVQTPLNARLQSFGIDSHLSGFLAGEYSHGGKAQEDRQLAVRAPRLESPYARALA